MESISLILVRFAQHPHSLSLSELWYLLWYKQAIYFLLCSWNKVFFYDCIETCDFILLWCCILCLDSLKSFEVMTSPKSRFKSKVWPCIFICLQGPMGWIQRQMNLGIDPEDILAYMVPHAQMVRDYDDDLFYCEIFPLMWSTTIIVIVVPLQLTSRATGCDENLPYVH